MIFFDKDDPAGNALSVPSRRDVAIQDTWDLTHLYGSDDSWDRAFEQLRLEFPAIQNFRGRVGESAASLLDTLETDKRLDLQMERLGHYAMLRSSEDSSDDANLSRQSRLQNLATLIAEAGAYIVPEIMELSDARFSEVLKSENLRPWRNSLLRLRRGKPHTLSAAEERLLALSGNALHGHSETFSQLTNVDMKFGTVRDAAGMERPLTQSSFSSFLNSPDAAVRKQAFHQFYEEFSDHRYTLAATLASSIRTDIFKAKARNHPSALEASLFRDAIPVTVYENLISTVREYLEPLHDYYDLRKEALGLGELHAYDTYVPLVSEIETQVSFDEATEKVIAALAPLGKEYCGILADGIRNRWCDRYESKGKRSGAFSSSSYGNPPFIMMNYKADVFSDVYTLAHEAGHSMHTWYAQKTQSFQDYHYPIFSAEVASTFNEHLLTDHLLADTKDRRLRAYLLNRQIDDLRGTLYRQTMFAEFEKIIHEKEESGEAVTLDAFRETYQRLLETYFGPRVILDPELQLECLRIPHFYSAFYVYKYATGVSAATALADRVLAGGADEAVRYLSFLESGGSKYPLETLRLAGVDMSEPSPIRATLELFKKRVGELRELLS